MKGIGFRFWVLTSLLLSAFLVCAGIIEAYLTYGDSLEHAERLQRMEARAAADKIAQTLGSIERQFTDIALLPRASGAITLADMQEEFHRTMKLVPAIWEINSVDRAGRERLYVSRAGMDRIDSQRDVPGAADLPIPEAGRIAYGTVFFREGARPFVALAVREGNAAGVETTMALLDLRFVTEAVQGMMIGTTGKAYVVDAKGRLLADPEISLVLRNTNIRDLAHIAEARRALAEERRTELPAMWSRNHAGERVLVSAAYIPGPDWIMFAEQPADEALAPVRRTLLRTGILLLLGLAAAAAASFLFSRRVTRPILDLQRGVTRIGAGDLGARIEIATRDEVQQLAEECGIL